MTERRSLIRVILPPIGHADSILVPYKQALTTTGFKTLVAKDLARRNIAAEDFNLVMTHSGKTLSEKHIARHCDGGTRAPTEHDDHQYDLELFLVPKTARRKTMMRFTSKGKNAESFVADLERTQGMTPADASFLKDAFTKEGIVSMLDVKSLSREDLQEMGIKVALRNRILRTILELTQQSCIHYDCPTCKLQQEVLNAVETCDDPNDSSDDEQEENVERKRMSATPEQLANIAAEEARITKRENEAKEEAARLEKLERLEALEQESDKTRDKDKLQPEEAGKKGRGKLRDKGKKKTKGKFSMPWGSSKDGLMDGNSARMVSYDVIKVNIRGRKQGRTLQLTPTHIHNVRSGKISSKHLYGDVFCVTLQDPQTVCISYINDHDYVYISPVATQIVQLINDRLAGARSREKSVFTYNLVNSDKATPATDDDDEEDDAKHLALRTHSRQQLLNVLRDGPPGSRKGEAAVKNPQLAKLEALTGSTEAQRISHAVELLVLDTVRPEGRERARFIKNFPNLEKKPKSLCSVVRQFMDNMRKHIEIKCLTDIRQAQGGPGGESELDEETALRLVETAIEKAVIMPVYSKIAAVIMKQCKDKDKQIQLNLTYLQEQNQQFFGVKEGEISSTNWKSATFELALMNKKSLPCEKLQALLNTARAIYNSHNYEMNRKEAAVLLDKQAESIPTETDGEPDETKFQAKEFYLAADEFFPIFVYVVTHSDIECLEMNKNYMWSLCEPGSLQGEGGYYLTVFEACLEYVHNFSIKDQLEKDKGNTAEV